MPIADTRELLLQELCKLYDAEHRFLEGQVQMVHRATDPKLQSSMENHIHQSRRHIRNLELFFGELGQEPRRETNEAAKGLVSEAHQGIEETRSDALRDCAINAAIIKVEHMEIGSYRSLLTGPHGRAKRRRTPPESAAGGTARRGRADRQGKKV